MNPDVFVSVSNLKRLLIPRKSILLAEVDTALELILLTMSYSEPAVKRHPMGNETRLEPVTIGIENYEWIPFYKWFTGEDLFPEKMGQDESFQADNTTREILSFAKDRSITLSQIIAMFPRFVENAVIKHVMNMIDNGYLQNHEVDGQTYYRIPNA